MNNDDTSSPTDAHHWVSDVFECYWDDQDPTILIIEYHRSYTWHEYHALMQAVYDYIDGRVEAIAYINVLHSRIAFPKGSPLPHMQKMMELFKDPIIILVNIERQRVLARFLTMVASALNTKSRTAPTVAAARKMIYAARADV